MKELIAHLRKLNALRTPGKWQGNWCGHGPIEEPMRYPISTDGGVDGYPEPGSGLIAETLNSNNSLYIAAISNALPDLLSALEVSWAESDQLRKELDEANKEIVSIYNMMENFD